jgi:hypothetical protein
MSKTGIAFIDAFSFINIFIPLLPVVFIFIQKKYSEEALIFLMILCVVNFAQNIFLSVPQLTNSIQNTIQNIFSVIELIIILQICRLAMNGKLKETINVFLIIFLTAIITFYSVKEISQKRIIAEIIQNIIIVVVIIIILFDLIENSSLTIFNDPVFWIGAGTLFYFLIALIASIVDSSSDTLKDRIIILNIATFIRYFFYALAVLFYTRNKKSEDSSSY